MAHQFNKKNYEFDNMSVYTEDLEEDKRWDDWTDDEEEAKCLFCDHHEVPSKVFIHMIQEHNFDFTSLRKKEKLNFYECIKIINYIRKNIKENTKDFKISNETTKKDLQNILEDDTYLQPVIEEDALLYAFEDEDEEAYDPEEEKKQNEINEANSKAEMELIKKVHETEDKLKKMEKAFMEYKEMVKNTFYNEKAINVITPQESKEISEDSDDENLIVDELDTDYYFTSYANTEIHIQMLQDSVRTSSYRDFFYNNKNFFKGKTVLDVGCGTGILSMFAAKAGARKVYSVDNSSIIYKAKKIVKENGLDNIITLYHGQIEDIILPEKVDVIVSEWMGYFLLFEGMLDSVILARDKWMKEGGLMGPSDTSMILAAIENEDWINSGYNYWNDVYGFKMTTMKGDFIKDGQVEVMNPKSVISDEVVIKSWDLNKAKVEDLSFTSNFKLTCTRDGRIHGICGYFDITFKCPEDPTFDQVYFTTSLTSKPTHWKQCTFILEKPFDVKAGTVIEGEIIIARLKRNHRDLKIDLSLTKGQEGEAKEVVLEKTRYFVR